MKSTTVPYLPQFSAVAFALIVALHSVFSINQAEAIVLQNSTDERIALLKSVAQQLQTKSGTPGAAITVVDGESIHSFVLGYGDLKSKTPVSDDTLFAIGSCTKAFTGVLAAKLVEAKKLNWDQPVKELNPNFQMSQAYPSNNTTIKDIFTHNTGLARHDMLWFDAPITRQDLLNKLPSLEMGTGFRKRYTYNNLMFSIGGTILETVSDEEWDSQIRRQIFEPLGMKNSCTKFEEFCSDPNRSTGYEPDGKTPVPHRNVDTVGPAGAIGSTLKDMTIWLQMLINSGKHQGNTFLNAKQFDFLTSPQVVIQPTENNFYGIGWNVRWDHGIKVIGHGGGIDGQNCFVSFVPELGFGIVVLANQQSDFDDLLVNYAVDLFTNGKLVRDSDKEFAMEKRRESKVEQIKTRNSRETESNPQTLLPLPREIANYTGSFVHPAYGTLEIHQKAEGGLGFKLGNYKGNVLFSGHDRFVGLSDTMGSIPLNYHFSDRENAYLTARLQGGEPLLKFKHKGERYVQSPAKTSVAETVLRAAMEADIKGALQKFENIKNDENYYFREDEMNQAGYVLLQSEADLAAIEIFKLNTRSFPDSWNAWDSLGEAYAKHGDKEKAIEAYQKSITLNPQNKGAREMLKELEQPIQD